jgi:hypothetical protein
MAVYWVDADVSETLAASINMAIALRTRRRQNLKSQKWHDSNCNRNLIPDSFVGLSQTRPQRYCFVGEVCIKLLLLQHSHLHNIYINFIIDINKSGKVSSTAPTTESLYPQTELNAGLQYEKCVRDITQCPFHLLLLSQIFLCRLYLTDDHTVHY